MFLMCNVLNGSFKVVLFFTQFEDVSGAESSEGCSPVKVRLNLLLPVK